jgi:hypothetical protein
MKFIAGCAPGCTSCAVILFILIICQALVLPADSFAISDKEYRNFAKSVVDYRRHLNPRFRKTERKSTHYIIVHTSECDLKTTLKIVLKGKQDNYRWVSHGGHAHYVIARNGKTYLILDKKYKAHHAGLSMWNGQTKLNRSSVGIELVAYHDGGITKNQYRSVRLLIERLKRHYRLDNLAVLTHSQVAYARPNRHIHRNHRGRKHCARNFDRIRAGLGPTWPYDPDVKAGRLKPEPELADRFYEHTLKGKKPIADVIDRDKTLWAIAGKAYDSPNTLYRLPNGFIISGNRVGSRIGWHQIPIGTKIFLF